MMDDPDYIDGWTNNEGMELDYDEVPDVIAEPDPDDHDSIVTDGYSDVSDVSGDDCVSEQADSYSGDDEPIIIDDDEPGLIEDYETTEELMVMASVQAVFQRSHVPRPPNDVVRTVDLTGDIDPEVLDTEISETSECYESEMCLRLDQAVTDVAKGAYEVGVAEGVQAAVACFQTLYGVVLELPPGYNTAGCTRQKEGALRDLRHCRGLCVTRPTGIWFCDSADLSQTPLRDVGTQGVPEVASTEVQTHPRPLTIESSVQATVQTREQCEQPYFPPMPKQDERTQVTEDCFQDKPELLPKKIEVQPNPRCFQDKPELLPKKIEVQPNPRCFQGKPEVVKKPPRSPIRGPAKPRLMKSAVVKPIKRSPFTSASKPAESGSLKRPRINMEPVVQPKIPKLSEKDFIYQGKMRMYPVESGPRMNLTSTYFPNGLEIPMSVLDDEDLDRCLKLHVLNPEGIRTLARSVGVKHVTRGFTTWASKFWAGKLTWKDLLLGRCAYRWCRQSWTNYDGIHQCRDRPNSYREQPRADYYRSKAKKSSDYKSEYVRPEPKPQVRKCNKDRFIVHRPVVYGHR